MSEHSKSTLVPLAHTYGHSAAKAEKPESRPPEAVPNDHLTIATAYGPVTGILNENVRSWYGIPYGKSPVGKLRWQAPTAPEPWSEPLDCTEIAPVALQASDDGVTGSEDCLNLDIYSAPNAENLPVLVYIHGGGNNKGNTQEIPGFELASQDECVFVSLNYRIGILGFNCLPALQTKETDTGNYTLLDIAAALDWIRENIHRFGGDPNNITVSGFSAGGRNVIALLISPVFKGKFEKAISFSGGMTTAGEELSARKLASVLAPLAVEDGMAEQESAAFQWLLTDGDDVKEYLYSIESPRLAALMAHSAIRMSAFPHLFEDGVTIPKGGFETEHYYSVPLMMLTGSGEFSMFSLADPFFNRDKFTALSEEEQRAAKKYATRYGDDMYRIFNGQCSGETMYDHYDSHIYICEIQYGSLEPAASDLLGYGAFHGIFVPMLCSQNNYSAMMAGAFEKEGYQKMARQYNQYLKNFLYTGNPNGENLAQWKPWTPDEKVSIVFNADETACTVELTDVSKTYGDIISEMEADTTIPEELKMELNRNVINGRWFSAAQDEYFNAPDLWKSKFES